MFEFVPPEWAENPFGEENHDPFGLGESSSDSDSFIEEVAPPLPMIDEDVLEEVLGGEVPDREGEGGGEDPPQFVPFDEIADYDYVDLAAEEEEEQAAPANDDGFIDWIEGEDEPCQRERRGLKGPVFRPRPKPRLRPRPGQGPRRGTGIGKPIIRPTKQTSLKFLKTQGVDKIKVVDKLPAGAQKINIRYKGSDTSQTSYRGSQTLQTSLDSTLDGPALNAPARSFAQVQNNQNIFPLVPLASSTPLKTFGIASQPDLRQIQRLGSRDLTFSSPRSSQSSLQNTQVRASTYQGTLM